MPIQQLRQSGGGGVNAEDVIVTPAGNITETDVQGALEELDGLIAGAGSTPRLRLFWACESYLSGSGRFSSSLGGSGSITESAGIRINTGSTAGSTAVLIGQNFNALTINLFDENPKLTGYWYPTSNGTSGFTSWFITGCAIQVTQGATTLTAKHIGFIARNNVMYGSNANGSSQTITALSGVINLNASQFHVEARMTSGVDVKFYVNGVLKATHTTNLPTGAMVNEVSYFRCGIRQDASDSNSRFSSISSVELEYNGEV